MLGASLVSRHRVATPLGTGGLSFCMATVVSLEGKRKAPSLDPLLALCADDMVRVDREILAAHALAGRADPRARQPSGRRRRQAHAAAAHRRGGAAVRLSGRRRPPRQARDLRRVHPFGDPAARRRGRCERAAPRPADRQLGVGRQGLGAGRRLPVHALLRADGRCRLARHPGRAVAAPPRRSPRARCCSSSPSATSARPRRPISR